MRKLILGLIVLITSSAIAATKSYDMKFDLALDGEPIAYGQIVSKAGEKAVVYRDLEGGKAFIEVVANEGEIQGHKGILMKFVVGRVEKDGKRVVLSEPRVLAEEGKEAIVTVNEDSGKETVKLSVVAKRK